MTMGPTGRNRQSDKFTFCDNINIVNIIVDIGISFEITKNEKFS